MTEREFESMVTVIIGCCDTRSLDDADDRAAVVRAIMGGVWPEVKHAILEAKLGERPLPPEG